MTAIDTPPPLQPRGSDAPAAARRDAEGAALGQQDFLRLLTTQLRNQDPLNPMGNKEFLGQMAQFSTVSGIDRMNATLAGLQGGLAEVRLASAASLLGRQALVEGDTARADAAGDIRGRAVLESPAAGVTVEFADAETGVLLHSERYGPQPAGRVDFAWDGVPEALADAGRAVKVTAMAETEGGAERVSTEVYARIAGVELDAAGGAPTVTVEDYGRRPANEIPALRARP
jgi:flagellar basal-body rod modification protein FlgD